MSTTPDRSVGDAIDEVERRIALRRNRTVRHYEETRSEVGRVVARAAKWLPLLAVAGSLGVGLAAARAHARSPRPVRQAVRATATRGIVASIVALGLTALRFAASSEARVFWNALRSFRARRA